MLSISSPAARPVHPWPADLRVPTLACHGPDSAGREAVERFIADVFRARFGASVRQFAPILVSLHGPQGDCVAAAGYRGAQAGPLFLERYLAAPVQTLLPAASGQVPPRTRIVEVGHLAAGRTGEGQRLIRLLGPHLATQGFDWVVSTLTQELRRLFGRIGVAALALGMADPAALGEQAQQWGSYYDHRPLVLAGRLDAALFALDGPRRANA
jgi:hypothetical protein